VADCAVASRDPSPRPGLQFQSSPSNHPLPLAPAITHSGCAQAHESCSSLASRRDSPSKPRSSTRNDHCPCSGSSFRGSGLDGQWSRDRPGSWDGRSFPVDSSDSLPNWSRCQKSPGRPRGSTLDRQSWRRLPCLKELASTSTRTRWRRRYFRRGSECPWSLRKCLAGTVLLGCRVSEKRVCEERVEW